MASIEPAARGRRLIAIPILLLAAACSRRAPTLVPPSCEVEAVEGFASAAVAGRDAALKGRFAFLFRRPGLGRVEAVDPVGRPVFLVLFRDGRAFFALPGKKVYAEDDAGVMMERILGVRLLPDEAVRLLSGRWGEASGEGAWSVDRDGRGRVAGGVRDGFGFAVRAFFPGAAVPREITLSGPESSGRVKILKLGFNPEPREGAFDAAFLRSYSPRSWDGILGLLDR